MEGKTMILINSMQAKALAAFCESEDEPVMVFMADGQFNVQEAQALVFTKESVSVDVDTEGKTTRRVT